MAIEHAPGYAAPPILSIAQVFMSNSICVCYIIALINIYNLLFWHNYTFQSLNYVFRLLFRYLDALQARLAAWYGGFKGEYKRAIARSVLHALSRPEGGTDYAAENGRIREALTNQA